MGSVQAGSPADKAAQIALSLSTRNALLAAGVLGALSLPVYWRLVVDCDPGSRYSDYAFHLRLVGDLRQFDTWPAHPLFHACTYALAAALRWRFAVAAAVVLAVAQAGRAYLSARLFPRTGAVKCVALCVALALAMPLPNWWAFVSERYPEDWEPFAPSMPGWLWSLPSAYLGQVSPNAWHNPTGAFAVPFALLVFLAGLELYERPERRSALFLACALALSAVAKPNYALAYAPCVGDTAFQHVRARRLSLARAALLLVTVFLPLAIVLWRQHEVQRWDGMTGGRFVVAPLAVWSEWSPYVAVSLLLGIAFPLAATALYWQEARRDAGLMLAWGATLFGVLQFALFAEQTNVGLRGGFYWGAMLADAVLFAAASAFLLRQPPGWRRRLAFGVLGLHALSGAACLTRCLLVPELAGMF